MSERNIKQAFILGAGLGTRLRPITNTIPKVMVPIADGKPLLGHTIEFLRDQGITDFIINLHYLPDAIISHFGNGEKLGVRISYIDEREKLSGTGGALKKAEALLDEDFVFMYGDELHFIDIEPLIKAHVANDAFATIVLKTSDISSNGEIGEFDPATKRIIKWHTRPHEISQFTEQRMLNSGLYILSKKMLDYIPEGMAIKLDDEIISKVLAAGEAVYAFPTTEPILDIGTPEKYEAAKEYYRERRL